MLSANVCKPGTVYFSHKTIHNEAFHTKWYTYGITHSLRGQSHYLVASLVTLLVGFGCLPQSFGEPYQMLSRHLEFPLEFRKNFSPDSIKKCLIHVAIVISWNKSEIFDKT